MAGYYGRITMAGPADAAFHNRNDLVAPGTRTLQTHRESAVAAARRVLAGQNSREDAVEVARYLLRTLGMPESVVL